MLMKAKPKILLFIDWYRPGYRAGGPIQSCANLVDSLSDQFDFNIVTRNTDYCSIEPYLGIVPDTWIQQNNGSRIFYFSDKNLALSSIKEICRDPSYDLVYVNGIYSLYFSIAPLFFLRKDKKKKVIVAVRGMLASSAIQVKKHKKSVFIFLSKLFGLYKRVLFQASTNLERNDIVLAMGKNAAIFLAPNLPAKINNYGLKPLAKEFGKLKLVSIARISPEKNLLFALNVLKNCKASIEFDFYGPVYDKNYFEQCMRFCKDLPSNIVVNYRDAIESNKVNDILKQYHYLFLPTLGENFGHVIFESLSVGCPVIISDKTPWRQLQSKGVGYDLPLEQKAMFVDCIERVAELDQQAFSQTSVNAASFAQGYLNADASLNQNKQMFESQLNIS